MQLAKSTEDESEFNQFLTDIGNGRGKLLPIHGSFATEIPHEMTVNSLDDLFNFVFGALEQNYKTEKWLCSRVIIAPTDSDVDMVNEKMISRFPGD